MKIVLIPVLALFFLVGTGCADERLCAEIKDDTIFYEGLRCLEIGQEKEASSCFKKAEKKSSPFVAEKALRKLTESGIPQDRIESAYRLNRKFNSEENLSILCRLLMEEKMYDRVVSAVKDYGSDSVSDENTYYRLSALHRKNAPEFKKEFIKWCREKKFTKWHYDLYLESEILPDDKEMTPVRFCALVFERDFKHAYELVRPVLSDHKNMVPVFASAVGRALFYATPDLDEDISFLKALSGISEKEIQFYFFFYQARLLQKKGENEKSLEDFSRALSVAPGPSEYDNCLWYSLKTLAKISPARTVQFLKKYSSRWNDCRYFDDFLDEFSVTLLQQKLYDEYAVVAEFCGKNFSPDALSKYSYVAGRLVQLGMAKCQTSDEDFFERSVTSGGDSYFVFASAAASGVKRNPDNYAYSWGLEEPEFDPETDGYMRELVKFDILSSIYNEFRNNESKLSSETVALVAQYLSKKSSGENDCFVESVRVASREKVPAGGERLRKCCELAFPEAFYTETNRVCDEFFINRNLFYGLVRTESFFNANANSHAGAVGLSQLMRPTAADVAKKLKVKKYDLLDPETNLRFGAFYLAELLGRLDNSALLSVCSYNGGISRVRQWRKKSDLPEDLFLESIPVEETRNYGRFVTEAACMYAWLWEDKSPAETFCSLVNLRK